MCSVGTGPRSEHPGVGSFAHVCTRDWKLGTDLHCFVHGLLGVYVMMRVPEDFDEVLLLW